MSNNTHKTTEELISVLIRIKPKFEGGTENYYSGFNDAIHQVIGVVFAQLQQPAPARSKEENTISTKEVWKKYFDERIYTPTMHYDAKMNVFEDVWNAAMEEYRQQGQQQGDGFKSFLDLKEALIAHLSEGNQEEKYLHSGRKTYTKSELIEAIKNQEDEGVNLFASLLKLTIDLLHRGKIDNAEQGQQVTGTGWVKASERLPDLKISTKRDKWRDAETKAEISTVAAESAIKTGLSHLVEWLDESGAASQPAAPTEEQIKEARRQYEKQMRSAHPYDTDTLIDMYGCDYQRGIKWAVKWYASKLSNNQNK